MPNERCCFFGNRGSQKGEGGGGPTPGKYSQIILTNSIITDWLLRWRLGSWWHRGSWSGEVEVEDGEEVEVEAGGEEVDADDGRAKQRSVFAWQAVNLVNGPAVTRDGGPAAPTLLQVYSAAAAALFTNIFSALWSFYLAACASTLCCNCSAEAEVWHEQTNSVTPVLLPFPKIDQHSP